MKAANRCKLEMIFSLILVLSAALCQASPPKHILMDIESKGFRHDVLPVAAQIVKQLGQESGKFDVTVTEDSANAVTAENLKRYDAVFFFTTGDLPIADRAGFLNWVSKGHGFIGVHSATDTYHGYTPYTTMIGAEFMTHGPQVKVNVHVDDPHFPGVQKLAPSFTIFDEIYQFKNFDLSHRVHVILSLDKNPQTGVPGFYPIAWCQQYGKGRVFYDALGHRSDVWTSKIYQEQLLGGILWALKLEKGSAKPNGSELNPVKAD